MTNLSLDIKGLKEAYSAVPTPEMVKSSMSAALNKAAAWGRTRAAEQILTEMALPPGYVAPSGGRLTVSMKADPRKLEARISARRRPVSLARYLVSWNRSTGALVKVAPGRTKRMRRAFPVKLRRGTVLTDTQHNLGLAIRLRKGEKPNKYSQAVPMGGRSGANVYLLYAPSVQQAFIQNSGRGVALQLSPHIARRAEKEFYRVLDLKVAGRIK